jgi:hypothetical protein
MKLAIGALPYHPVRTRSTVLADPLDKSVIRLDHPELVGAGVGHFVGNLWRFCMWYSKGVDAIKSILVVLNPLTRFGLIGHGYVPRRTILALHA